MTALLTRYGIVQVGAGRRARETRAHVVRDLVSAPAFPAAPGNQQECSVRVGVHVDRPSHGAEHLEPLELRSRGLSLIQGHKL